MIIERFDIDNHAGIKNHFREYGFVIINNAFSNQILHDFAEEVAAIIRAHLQKASIFDAFEGTLIFDAAMEALEAVDHIYPASIYDTICQCPSFFRVISEKTITNPIRMLLGNEKAALYGYTNRCRIDPPNDNRRTYGWHQEVFYSVPRGRFVQCWAPLIRDTTKTNGTIEVAAGSHNEGIPRQAWHDINGRATQIIIDESVLEKYPKVAVEMTLGELMLLSGSLAHRSGSNISTEHRYSLVGMYHDVAAPEFWTPKIDFSWRGDSPREFFDSEKTAKGW